MAPQMALVRLGASAAPLLPGSVAEVTILALRPGERSEREQERTQS